MKRWHILAFFCLSVSFLPACSTITVSHPTDESPSVTEEKSYQIQEDRTQEAYLNFTLASLAIYRGDYENARKYLKSAIEKDPESVYLLTKMALLLIFLN